MQCAQHTHTHPEDLVAGALLPPDSYQLVRYEDLVAEPVATLRSLYEVQLDIDIVTLDTSRYLQSAILFLVHGCEVQSSHRGQGGGPLPCGEPAETSQVGALAFTVHCSCSSCYCLGWGQCQRLKEATSKTKV